MTFLLINESTGAITPLVVLARRYQILELSDPFRDDNGNYFDEIWDEEYVGVGGGIGGLAFTTFSSLSVSGSSGTVSIGPDYLNPEAETTGH